MKVTIHRCSNNNYWYKNNIGEDFEVESDFRDVTKYLVKNSHKTISIEDTIPIEKWRPDKNYTIDVNDAIEDEDLYPTEELYTQLRDFLHSKNASPELKQKLFILSERAKLFF